MEPAGLSEHSENIVYRHKVNTRQQKSWHPSDVKWEEKEKKSLQIQAEIIRRVSPQTMKGHLSFKKHLYCFQQSLLLQARW